MDVEAEGGHVFRKTDYSTITPVQESSYIEKALRSSSLTYDVANELINAQFAISARQYMNTNTLSEDVYEAWSQDAGVFYDLLPLGYIYNPTKGVQVFGANYGLSSSSVNSSGKQAALESVETIDDYKGTGRQMVIFRVKSLEKPGNNYCGTSYVYTGFGIHFWVQGSYDAVPCKVTEYNAVAFQRGDGQSMKGAYSERGYGADSSKLYFPLTEDGERVFYDVNGDGDVDETKTDTLYAYASIYASFLQTVQNGLGKLVKAKAGYYKKDDVVDLGADYTYRLRLQTSDNSVTKNVVIYDILENAKNSGGATGEPGDWRGSFVSASARSARNLGIEPVIWYSTVRNLSYNDSDSLLIESAPQNWSTTLPDDPSTVTAVAFDLRYSDVAEGTEFEFLNAQIVELYINMVAPDSLQEFEYAYNRPAYNSTFRAVNMPAELATTSLNISSRTTLALHDLQDLSFIKQYEPEGADDGVMERKPLAGVTFSLYQCTNEDANHTHTGFPGDTSSCWGSTAVYTTSSDANGKVEFKDLESGKYAFVESSTRTGFTKLTYRYWVFEADARKGTITAPVAYSTSASSYPPVELEWHEGEGDADGYYSLLNQRPTKTLGVRKYWDDGYSTLTRPASITFDLYRSTAANPYQEGDAPYKTAVMNITSTNSSMTNSSLFPNLYVYDELGNYYIYTIKERPVEGYTTDNDGKVTVSGSTSGTTSSVYNRRLGVLDVKKTLNNSSALTDFAFTLTLKDANDAPICPTDDEGNVLSFTVRRFAKDSTEYTTETATPDADGKVTFTLKNGELVRFIDLPIGAKWTVEETNGNYTVTPTGGSISGTTSRGTAGSAAFTNTPQPVTLALPFEKVLTGNDTPSDKTFNFSIAAVTTGAPMPSPATATVTGAAEGAFGNITYTKEGTYQYTVTETAGNDPGYTYDTASYTVTVTVTDNNGLLQTAWSAKKGTEDADALVFTNSYAPTPTTLSIPVTKAIQYVTPPSNKDFTFTLAAVTADAPLPNPATLTITGTGTANFADITYTAAGTYTYKLKETAGNDTGYTYDSTEFTITVEVTDTNGVLSAAWTAKIGDTTADSLTFTNDYAPLQTTLAIPVEKVITGKETPTDKTFTFTIAAAAENATAPLPTPATLSITGAGDASFAAITYTAKGTYKYTVTETANNENGYTYDTTPKSITVTVTDNNGQLTAAWKADADATAQKVTFTNSYAPAATTLAIPVKKTITGNPTPANKTFTFAIAAASTGAPLPTATTTTVTGAAEGAFGDITFDTAGTYSYTVTETAGNDTGYTYDSTAHTVTVTVTDTNGQLAAKWALAGDDTATAVGFTNAYAPTSVDVALSVTKEITGKEPPTNKDFTFVLTAKTDGAPMPNPATVTVTGAGTAAFADITFTAAGEYHYGLAEQAGSEPSYGYDATTREVVITVTDNNGVLQAAVKIDNVETTSATFTNTYNPKKASLSLSVTKVVDGDEPPKSQDFTFTLTAKGGAPMPTNNKEITISGNGTSAFGSIEYDTAGTYTYTVSENKGTAAGYTYDETVYDVEVTVTDTNGVLSASAAPNEATGIVFTNTYHAKSTDVIIPVKKTIDGKVPVGNDKTFSFKLEGADDEPMPQGDGNIATVVGAGNTAFGKITFKKEGTYKYKVTEIEGSERGYTYDSTEYSVTVVVTDEDAQLKAVCKVDGEAGKEIVFNNPYNPAPTSIVLGATKVLKNKKLKDDMFSFTLKDKEGNVLDTVTNTADGKVTFKELEFTEAGEYEYSIAEVEGNMSGVTYDTTSHIVKVIVKDNDGVLKAEVDSEHTPENNVFINVYTPKTSTDIPKTGDGFDRLMGTGVIGLMALVLLLVLHGSKKRVL